MPPVGGRSGHRSKGLAPKARRHRPPAGRDERPALVISIGGEFADEYPVPVILDNLIAGKRIPPTMVVSILFDGMTLLRPPQCLSVSVVNTNAGRSSERGLLQEATLCGARDAGIHHRDTEAQRGTEIRMTGIRSSRETPPENS